MRESDDSLYVYMNTGLSHTNELLSPAGNMECLKAAVIAGADAVYLAGKRFGARASADNFDEQELIEALDYAHSYDRRIYLTLNTLIKERELSDIYGFLKPLYAAGLDGIIIQDTGLIGYLKERFPDLMLHASTQMTVTHSSAARLLKELGICRVVTARELSLDEIRSIKRDTGLEIEVFIHGAMCYCYSGACLFSSFLGGRSGNRGRCAGPCRLPYNKDEYPLSMRDLCLAGHIGQLIEAGVDSFKIEGRLKSPEYVTGVTRVYRHLIDEYMSTGKTDATETELKELEALYLRGGRSVGYLFVHNGPDMITLKSPSYSGPSNETENALRQWSEARDIRMPVRVHAIFHVKQPMSLTLEYDRDVSITVKGDVIEEATGRPATKENVRARIGKTGGTPYIFDAIDLDMDDNCFLPVSSVNELRRRAVDELTKARLKGHRRNDTAADLKKTFADNSFAADDIPVRSSLCPDISVLNVEQLKAVMSGRIKPARVYVPYDLIYSGKHTADELETIVSDAADTEIYLSLPRIYRSRSDDYMTELREFIKDRSTLKKCRISGVLARNLEELELLKDADIKIVTDHSVYIWNRRALDRILEYADEVTLPLELNLHEIKDIISEEYAGRLNMVIYGRAPLMVSANCVMKTYGKCSGDLNGFKNMLTDRYGKSEPVYVNCLHCYNEIFNAVPTTYHKRLDDIKAMGIGRLRVDLTDESPRTVKELIGFYTESVAGDFPVSDYTTGHMDKGAI